ncbi:hypothetical protein Bbelb_434460 [Branchiostoma belcheri]|nr:hypothetical protein Bbelb_434460 [Branchiostoma belcheri]
MEKHGGRDVICTHACLSPIISCGLAFNQERACEQAPVWGTSSSAFEDVDGDNLDKGRRRRHIDLTLLITAQNITERLSYLSRPENLAWAVTVDSCWKTGWLPIIFMSFVAFVMAILQLPMARADPGLPTRITFIPLKAMRVRVRYDNSAFCVVTDVSLVSIYRPMYQSKLEGGTLWGYGWQGLTDNRFDTVFGGPENSQSGRL